MTDVFVVLLGELSLMSCPRRPLYTGRINHGVTSVTDRKPPVANPLPHRPATTPIRVKRGGGGGGGGRGV